MSKKRLGRGLDALLSSRSQPAPAQASRDAEADVNASGVTSGIARLLINDVVPSPYQPRRVFDEDALADLASSIKTNGLLQPIVVRSRAQGGFELIAGERRLRAAKLAGLVNIPALVKSVSEEQASALALIENMQREDLTALEEALGLARLRDEFELTQQQIADAVGKSRVAVANHLRLLNLGALARQMLENGDIEMGHARALLALEGVGQDRTAHAVVEQGLSVRQTEALIRKIANPEKETKAEPDRIKDPETLRLEQRIMDHIGAPVSISHTTSGKGQLKINYGSLDELQGVLRHLGLEDEHEQ
ncbi:MAG: ParB/RepB/Spo0J family partition protein [Pseudomonadales bacterium]|jgi:ParB family transcriptional regulator, chromosome partitioning protein|nr:ParB/RepB/Spo0J family partition protein [Pseudomonadales bacterium]